MNIIKKIRLSLSRFFKIQKPIKPFVVDNIFIKEFAAETFSAKNRDRLLHLAGIGPQAKKSAAERAHNKLQAKELDLEYKKLLYLPNKVAAIKKWAVAEAANKIEQSELALAMAEAMEERNRRVEKENSTFDEAWTKYAKKNIKKRDPKAKDFAKFLVELSYLDKELLDEVAVSAIFFDNKIFNFRQFRSELNRVKALIAA